MKTTDAQAAVFETVGSAMNLNPFKVEELEPGQVLLEIECCTLCASDLHTIYGRRPFHRPFVPGHEVVGKVTASSGAITDLDGRAVASGDRIVFSIAVSCKNCSSCLSGFEQKCAQLAKYGHGPAENNLLTGGLATHMILAAGSDIYRVPASLPAHIASTISCAGATAMSAVRQAGEINDRNVLIIGGGMLGIWSAAIFSSMGASTFIVEPSDRRREGQPITALCNAPEGFQSIEAVPDLKSLHPDRPFAAIVEACGAPDTIGQSLPLLGTGGRLILLGHVMKSKDVCINPEKIVRGLHQIIGVHNYRPVDLKAAAQFAVENAAWFDEILKGTPVFNLEDVNNAIEASEAGTSLRVAVKPR